MGPVSQLLFTLVYCVGAGMVPILNAEASMAAMGVMTGPPGHFVWLLAFAAATGQMASKMLLFASGRGVISAGWLRRRVGEPGRWSRLMDRLRAWAVRRPWGPSVVTLVSSVGGLPPMLLWSVLAGSLGMRWWIFLACGFAGRYLRFAAVFAAADVLRAWWG